MFFLFKLFLSGVSIFYGWKIFRKRAKKKIFSKKIKQLENELDAESIKKAEKNAKEYIKKENIKRLSNLYIDKSG